MQELKILPTEEHPLLCFRELEPLCGGTLTEAPVANAILQLSADGDPSVTASLSERIVTSTSLSLTRSEMQLATDYISKSQRSLYRAFHNDRSSGYNLSPI